MSAHRSSSRPRLVLPQRQPCVLFVGALLVVGMLGLSESVHASGSGPAPVVARNLFPLPSGARTEASRVIRGPLQVLSSNPRYFTDGSGRAIYLTGSHTWSNFKDMSPQDPPQPFDYQAYLDFLVRQNHNFMRMWTWDLTQYTYTGTLDFTDPFPWKRTGPGNALDGKPKFDLDQFNQAYFDRLRQRVIDAGERGIYVSVMLFEGHGIQHSQEPWRWDGHPFNQSNNFNGIDGDPDSDGLGIEIQTLQIPAVAERQRAYLHKVVDTLNDLDNVLYEISNESHSGSQDWQYAMIEYVKEYEAAKPKQHPVGMTVEYPNGSNAELFASPADWISPNSDGGYRSSPPAADGSKVILSDTDHLWGIGGDRVWVWKSFTRGLNPIYMDSYPEGNTEGGDDPPPDQSLRDNLGYALAYAERIDLASMTPRGSLASTGYCLAHPARDGTEYLVYLPSGGTVTVDLSVASGTLNAEWFNPGNGAVIPGSPTTGGANRDFTAPFSGDAVLYVFDPNLLTPTPTASPSPTATPQPSFADVPPEHPYFDPIEALYQAGLTAGCAVDPLRYCPEKTMNRAESSVFVERGIHDDDYFPVQPTLQLFADLPLDSWAAKWANALYEDGYTAGCGTDPLIYCPWQGHTRAEGCVFYLHMVNGSGYLPEPPTEQRFADVPLDTWYAKWVEAAYQAGLVQPCQTIPEFLFCPNDPLPRAVAAFMMSEAKGLPLAGLSGGVLATFDVQGERFRAWVTNPTTIQQLLDLRDNPDLGTFPSGRIWRGQGQSFHNLPWSWHLDPETTVMTQAAIELCDGTPTYVEANLSTFIDDVQTFCPWSATLVGLRDYR